jgi:hypothetical protein
MSNMPAIMREDMTGYRLVNSVHDPIAVGAFLDRGSTKSNQKIAEGMYFAPSREDALIFANKSHGHTYFHLLTCELIGVSEQDVVDLVVNPNLIAHWVRRRDYPTRKATTTAFCRDSGKKVIIWQSQPSQSSETWTEICLLTEYIPNTVLITHVEELKA